MMAKLRIGVSPLTGVIYAGTLSKSNLWGKNKTDVTDDALSAVAYSLLHTKQSLQFTHGDKKYILKVVEIKEEGVAVMTNNKQQTAVEWLYNELLNSEPNILEWNKLLEQAKLMEKEQIKDAYWNGSDGIKTKTQILNEAEQFFNETYGGNK